MLIPNFLDSKVIEEDGTLTNTWKQILSSLFAQLQRSISEEGVQIPSQSTENINKISGTDTIGRLLYDSTTNELKININGEFKVIQIL